MSEPRDEIAETAAVAGIIAAARLRAAADEESPALAAARAILASDWLAQRDRRVAAEAVLEFVAWIARARAHNGSDHQFGQSLYNECVNAALPVWAAEWIMGGE